MRSLIVRCSIIALFFTLAFLDQAQAQYHLRFRVYENGPMCGCYSREGVIVRLDANFNRVYYYAAELLPNSSSVYQYDLNLDYDPRDYKWSFEHIPNSAAGCTVYTFSGCGFVGTSNIPIYSGPDVCGVTDVDIPPTPNYIRGLFIAVEFSGPQSPPTLPGGIALDNICAETLTIETAEKVTTETYTWEVSRSASGPWKTFATTTGADVNKTTISAALLNQKIGDGQSGNDFQVRITTTGGCGTWSARSSTPTSVKFKSPAPSIPVSIGVSPSCIGGDDGSIKITELRNTDGSLFPLTGDLLSYTLTGATSHFVYKIQSTILPVLFDKTNTGGNFPIFADSWQIQIEGAGSTCVTSASSPKVIADPPAMALQSAAVSQPILCTGGKGSISAAITNGKAPYTYGITGLGNVISSAQNNTFSNLSSGNNYVVSVTDACNQSVTSGFINLPEPTGVISIPSLTAQNVSCAGQNNGKLTVFISGGTTPYAVQVDGGIFTGILGNSYTGGGLAAGSHSVVVRDANGCEASGSVVVNTNAAVKGSINPDDLKSATCAGGNNGLIILTASGSPGVAFEYSLNGAAFQTINAFADLSAGTYAVSIRDKNAPACRWDSSVVIAEPPAIHVDEFVVASAISCYGESNGILRASASGGNPQFGYTYSLSELNSGANDSHTSSGSVLFDNLPAGNYRLTVADGTVNCFVTRDLSLSEPSAVFFNPVLSNHNGQHVSCTNSSDGSITIRSTGSVYPHRISVSGRPDQLINSSSETAVFSNFQAGDYFFTITSNNGACQKDTVIRLIAPAPVSISLSAKQYGDGYQVSCKGSGNGIVSANASGGTLPYTYSISPAGTPLSYTSVNLDSVGFANLFAGTYNVSLKDMNNCSISNQIVLTEPALLQVSSIVKPDIFGRQLTCHGDQNALVTVFTTGGSYPQTISLQTPAQQGSTNSTTQGVQFSNLAAGTYNFSITDEEGCTANGSFNLVEPDAVSLNTAATILNKPDCAGQPTGSLHLQALGGIGTSYQYQLTYFGDRSRLPFPYPEQQDQTGNPVDFDLLIAGSYGLQVKDEVGCIHTEPLTIATNLQVQAIVSTTDITCKRDTDGTASVAISGGVAPYTLLWNYHDQTIQTNNNIGEHVPSAINNLKEGLYSFEISDANGCAFYTGNYNFQVEGPSEALVLGSSTKQITCHGNDNGVVILEATGGWQESAYRYGMDVNHLAVNQKIYEDLVPGVYRYFAMDNRGCIDTLDVTILEPAVLSASISETKNVSCHGLSDGSFVLAIQGGTVPYQLSVDNGLTWKKGNELDALKAASYTALVQDSNLCATSQVVVITEPDALLATLVSQTNTLCKQSTGSATVSIAGGTPAYVYSWTNDEQVNIGSALTVSDLKAGTYQFKVVDHQACENSLPVTIINTNDIVFDVANIIPVNCFGDANGSASLNITTIQSPYTILWSNGAASLSTASLTAGDNTVVLEDANQCQVSKSFVVPGPEALAVSSTQSLSPSCYGTCNGSLTVQAAGGNGGYKYSWLSNSSTSGAITNACAGVYTVTVKDAKNCVLTKNFNLSGPALHKLGLEDTTYHICQGQKVNINLADWNSVSWSSGNGFSSSANAVVLAQAGDYQVSATDASGCQSTASFKVIYSTDLLKAEFLVPKETYAKDTIVCVNISMPRPDSWTWQFDESKVVSINNEGAYQHLVFLEEGEYQITLTTHLGSCVAEQTKTVIVLKEKPRDEENDPLGYKEDGIKDVTVFPNPNDGNFTCEVILYKEEELELKVMDLYGHVLTSRQATKQIEFQTDLSIGQQPAGLYWLVVKVGDHMKIVKVLVK